MTALPTAPVRPRDWADYATVPPPPMAPRQPPPAVPAPAQPEPMVVERKGQPPKGQSMLRPAGHEFDAELDATELDERDRPGPTWTARGQRLSRSNLSIRTRRMSFPGRRLLLAVHLIDSQPVTLFGIIRSCEYNGEGMYLIDLDLMPVPDRPDVEEWVEQMSKGR